MKGINHHTVTANGIDIHLAESGQGPAVVLCHGFPETWYSWRNQIPVLVEAGYRVVAMDMRGFGETSAPERLDAYTQLHMVGDVIGVLDGLKLPNAVIVGHDWGALVAWNAALMRPDRIRAVAGLSVPYMPRSGTSVLQAMRARGNDGFYMAYFQQPDVPEEDLERDVELSLKRIFYTLSGDPPEAERWKAVVPKGLTFVQSLAEPKQLPAWLSQAELDVYVKSYRRTGFRGGLNWYRNSDRNTELLAPFHGAGISVPALYVAGKRDAVVQWSEQSIRQLPVNLRDWRGTVLLENAGHWVQQEAPAEVNKALLQFLASLPRDDQDARRSIGGDTRLPT